MARFTKRLQTELRSFQRESPVGISVEDTSDDLTRWVIKVVGSEGTLYQGEVFYLQFRFPAMYPMESPEVIFIGNNVPIHPHIYSNGHICLSILYDNWSPALTACSVCLSIQSMLSSSDKKVRPQDNDSYVRNNNGKSPKETRWWFHDDTC